MEARKTRPALDGVLTSKIRRIAGGEQPRVLDLFSGAGGISLGFHRAGCRIDGALEIDPLAARTHALNFHGSDPESLILHSRPRDMTVMEPQDLATELDLGHMPDAIDILVGGPPCQAYARIGRAKLREVAEHPDAYRIDPRGSLFVRYLHYVRAFRPLALLLENVPDILHYGQRNVVEEIIESLDAMGYDARYTLVNTAFHGVPQMRDRVFIIAVVKGLSAEIRFPLPTRHIELPQGYAGVRSVALRYVDRTGARGFVVPPSDTTLLPFAVTAGEAIGDLPFIHGESVRRGTRKFDTVSEYRRSGCSVYAKSMREWPGFTSLIGVRDHVIRFLPRDGRTFSAMAEGDEYPAAHATALRLLDAEAARLGIQKGSLRYRELLDRMVPPYDVAKFPNRWWKIRRDFPVRTLMAHIGKDTYSHIHYDGAQARTISVREAARLQSFPDGFVFAGSMNAAFRQIGNAVPPLMAFAMAQAIRGLLEESAGRVSGLAPATPQVAAAA